MVLITGTIQLESVAELERVRDALVARAQRSRRDAGNIAYSFAQDLNDPCIIILSEKWENETSLNDHLGVPDKAFDDVLATAKITAASVTAHSCESERVLMSR